MIIFGYHMRGPLIKGGARRLWGVFAHETSLIFADFQNSLRQKAPEAVSGYFGRRIFLLFVVINK